MNINVMHQYVVNNEKNFKVHEFNRENQKKNYRNNLKNNYV